MRTISTDDEGVLQVLEREGDRGTKGPFYAVYRPGAGDGSTDANVIEPGERYGWFCGNCESLDTAMDTMGRVQCTRCDNLRKPTEWDAAHE